MIKRRLLRFLLDCYPGHTVWAVAQVEVPSDTAPILTWADNRFQGMGRGGLLILFSNDSRCTVI